jgi:DNA-binding beta-propeller fold protein YncE
VPNTSDTHRPGHRGRALAVAAAATIAACGFGESGIAPPTDRFFFPASIAVDPAGDWLYVVNSNSDLRYNAGTVVAVNLALARQDRARSDWPRCPNSAYLPPLSGPARLCCQDFLDQGITNCDERGYVAADTTVSIGSFGGTVAVQNLAPGGVDRRLFVAVRAEPSITFIDVSVANGARMVCNDAGAKPNALCGDGWRLRTGPIQDDGLPLALQEEPHGMVLDDGLGVIYIAHLGAVEQGRQLVRGISVLDVCAPSVRKPRLAAALQDASPRSGSLGITTVVSAQPGDPLGVLYATEEFTSNIVEVRFRDPDQARCDSGASPERVLDMVPGRRFSSSIYGTRGADLRGLLLPPPGDRAYVLHKEYADRLHAEYNPPSVVAIDRSLDQRGDPLNRPVAMVEVCTGPTQLVWHDAGRGPRLFVNCFEGGQVYVVDPGLMVVDAVIEVGAGPADLQFSPNDPALAYVAGFANNNVSVIDLRPGTATEYRVIQRIGFPRSSTTLR